jgi:hypothetical protein
MTVADAPDPYDVLTLLERLVREGAAAAVCDERANVAAFVWLGTGGLATLAEELERQREDGNVDVEQAAYALRDGSLVIAGQGSRGAFAFSVPAGGWSWCRPLV